VLRQTHNLARHLLDDARLVVGGAVLQHVLNDVVAVLVQHEALDLVVQLLQHGALLVVVAVLQDALDHAAAVRMGGQRENLHVRWVYY